MILTRTRLLAAGLLVASTIAFAVASAVERHSSSETSPPAATATAGDHDSDGGEATGEPVSGTAHNESAHSETLLGINPESTGLVVAGVVLSLLLAAGLLWLRSPLVAAGAGLAMIVFTALDVREAVHQVDESRTGLALFAVLVALLHLLAAAAAFAVARSSRRGSQLPRVA